MQAAKSLLHYIPYDPYKPYPPTAQSFCPALSLRFVTMPAVQQGAIRSSISRCAVIMLNSQTLVIP